MVEKKPKSIKEQLSDILDKEERIKARNQMLQDVRSCHATGRYAMKSDQHRAKCIYVPEIEGIQIFCKYRKKFKRKSFCKKYKTKNLT
jgi:hypothetical protein